MAIDVERSGHLATVTLNRPEVHNAFNTEQLTALIERIGELRGDPEIRVIIVTGAGDRAFASGADIAEMRDMTPARALGWSRLGQTACAALESAPQAVIAAVNGYAFGGGCELALACDIRLCSENAIFGQTEVTLGILPGWGGTQRLTRVVGPGVAKEMILSGRRLDAAEAQRLGLVSSVYPRADLMVKARALAEQIAGNAPIAVAYAKDAINRALDVDVSSGLAYEAQVFALTFATDDQREGMSAFLERRKARYRGK